MDAVIFDMDGVLIDSENFYFKRRMRFFELQNEEPGSRDIKNFIGKTEKQIWEILVPNNKDKRDFLYNKHIEYKKNNPIPFATVLRPSVKNVVSKLYENGVILAIASSSPEEEIKKMLSECDLSKYFSFVISGHNLINSKPDPEIYNKCKAALGCETYYAVEDSEVGIASSKSAGIFTFALKQDVNIDQSGADKIIHNLNEMLDCILL